MKRLKGELLVGSSGRAVSPEMIEEIIKAIQRYEKEKSVASIGKTLRNHALYKEIVKTKYVGRRIALLKILLQWAMGDGKDEQFSTWEGAVHAASLQLNAQEARKGFSKEEQEARTKELSAILDGLATDIETDINESSLSVEKRQKLTEDVLPEIRRAASEVTDLFTRDLDELPKEDDEDLPLGVHRRKQHKSGVNDLVGYEVQYRTYEGTISPKPNAFILGGSLPGDYGPLFKDLIAAIALETKEQGKPWGDKEIAQLFLSEFDGKNAFGLFSKHIQNLAHKIVAIMLFAELARHSVALISAAATFFVIASHKSAPGLVESFLTGSDNLRPLFAGTGGPNLMRGKEVSELSASEIQKRGARAALDLSIFFEANKSKGEDISTFIKRQTFQYIYNLSKNSSHSTASGFEMMSVVPVLVDLLKRIVKSSNKDNNPIATLVALGFTHHSQPGDENNCAIETIYDQLMHHLGLEKAGYEVFVKYVRERINVPFGQMIDIATQGQALLAATQAYLQETGHNQPPLVIDVWAATGDGGLMEFQNVAQVGGTGATVYLTFYYNGVNHFDSLIGGPSRH
jgi:hypothetical protein